MNSYDVDSPKQERLTFKDTKGKQQIMREYLSAKINNPIIIEEDKKILPSILADALLSQPALSGVKPTIELKGIRIPLSSNVYGLLLKILELNTYKKSDDKYYGKFTLRNKEYEIELSSLWRLLLNYCDQLSAGALAEALSRSKEKEIHRGIEVRDFSE